MDTKRRLACATACCLAVLLAAWALAVALRPAAVLLAIATASRGCQIRRSQESRVTNNREGRRRGGVQSKLAVEASTSLLRAIGRPARMRAACVDAAGCWAAELQGVVGSFQLGCGCRYLGQGVSIQKNYILDQVR